MKWYKMVQNETETKKLALEKVSFNTIQNCLRLQENLTLFSFISPGSCTIKLFTAVIYGFS